MKTSEQIRKEYLDFWSEAPRNSKAIPNASLVPLGDSTLLFVNSGMFPIVPYLAGQPHPLGTRVHNVQRCVRTIDIDDVGDNRHLVLFEMIGNWSFGDFTKAEQIPWCLDLYINKFGLDPKRLYITVWAGDDVVPRDDEAINLWKKAFKDICKMDVEFAEDIENIPKDLKEGEDWKYRIFPYGRHDNWWERGHAKNELGGPSSELFYDLGVKERDQDKYHINDDSGRFVEVGNNVFMEYRLDENLNYKPLEKKNIDFGGGFDRIIIAVQDKVDVYATDLFQDIIEGIEKLSEKKYKGGIEINEDTKSFRVVAEHIRSSVFILADGIIPSGKDQGYILRRLIRRMIRFAKKLNIEQDFTGELAKVVIGKMSEAYPHLKQNENFIIDELDKEEIKFRKTLDRGLRELEKSRSEFEKYLEVIREVRSDQTPNFAVGKHEDKNEVEYHEREGRSGFFGQLAFHIYETYGFPLELVLEEMNVTDSKDIDMITRGFKVEETLHRNQSRSGAEQKFKGGLADQSVETTKLHTAHHLLLAALQQIVNPDIKQKGSNITAERLRIDFNYGEKLTDEQVKKVEDLVNKKIEEGLKVSRVEMPREEAEKLGAQMEFGQKYPDTVSVYMVGGENNTGWFSAEFCGGPHVGNTKELCEGNKKFKILKQENIGNGVRRIKAGLV